MKYIVLNIVLLFALIANAQDYKRTQNWYFGDSAGLSFATDPPTVLTDGAMSTIEGCATISDTAGNLLFYTNGVKVWNKNHQIMDNGTGLKGHVSSTQSSLIVPYPENDSLFYIFTTDAVGQFNGLQYSLVNIKENGGLGKVIVKNILLHTPVCEKLTATYHQNGKDIWVLAHEYASDAFVLFLVKSDGINQCPIIQRVGKKYGVNTSDVTAAQGAMKFSGEGNYVVSCLWSNQFFELYKFNSENGEIYSPLTFQFFYPFYAEFSNDNNFLYITDRGKNLFSYQIGKYNNDSIEASKKTIKTYTNEVIDAVQIGADKKIYVCFHDSLRLGRIANNDSLNLSQQLSPNRAMYGLPNFVTSYFYTPKLDFTYITNCQNNLINFSVKGGQSHTWKIFRNKAILHTSAQATTNFNFTDTGEYTIQLVSGTDTVTKIIYIEPKLSLGQDTILCNQNSYTFNISQNHRCITWQDGADSTKYTIKQSGAYSVNAYNIRGCLVSDTVKVTFTNLAPPVITKSNDSLFTDSGNYTYNWYYNTAPIPSNTHTIKITKNGSYRVEIIDSNGCTNTSSNFLVSGLGIQLLNAQDYFKVYPIPAQHKLFIVPSTNTAITDITIVDAIGREFQHTPATEIDLAAFSKGIYYLKITDHQSKTYITKFIIN